MDQNFNGVSPAVRRKQKPVEFSTDGVEVPQQQEVVDVKPANILDLPSKGMFGYPSFVQYRDILAKDEETLSMTTAENYARTLNGVIKSVLLDCSFFEQMTIHDRDYVLVWLWSNNYAPTKRVDVTCKHCKTVNHHKVDMTKLDITEPKAGFPGFMEMKLKNAGTIRVKLRTVADEIATETFMMTNKNYKFENLMTIQTIDVGMVIPMESKIKWVGENVTGREMAIIKKFHEHYFYGVNTQLTNTCSACGGATQFELPFQAEDILYPKLADDSEELLRFM